MTKLIVKIVLLFSLLICLAEVSIRTVFRSQFAGLERLDDFYRVARDAASAGPIDMMFIGSSHVFAAVNEDIVADELESMTGRRPQVVEIGKGYSTVALHYLGLKSLYEQYPDQMNGTIILIESPGRMPLYQTWNDFWVDDEWPSLLGSVASPPDVWRFLTHSSNDLRSKFVAAASVPLRTVRFARRIPPNIEKKVNTLLIGEEEAVVETDLAGGGEIRTDSALVARVRADVIREFGSYEMKLRDRWDDSVTDDIVDLVRAHGGDVIFFEMPLSSHEQRGFDSEIGTQSRQHFRDWAAAKGVTQLEFDFPTTDEDFPDLLHLSASRSVGYTQMVARAVGTELDRKRRGPASEGR